MLGGYGNTALAAGMNTSGNQEIEYIQEETGTAGGENTAPGTGETVTDPKVPETGTEEEKPSEGETDPKEETDPPKEEIPSEDPEPEEPGLEDPVSEEEVTAAAQQERAYQPYWPNPNFTNLVVFVDFADTTHAHPASIYPDAECYKKNPETTFGYFNGDEKNYKAMRQYLYNISYGQLKVENVFPQYDGTSITSYQLPKNGSYYAQHESEMIQEVIKKLQGQIPQGISLDLRDGGDGFLDNLTVVVPCDNENKTTLFVGHMSNYTGSEQVGGKGVRAYNIVAEEDIYFGNLKSGLIIHEFLHTMGYPDLYRSVKNVETGKNIPVSLWDIMATENHRVQYPLAYLRSAITKWFDIPVLTESKQGLSLYAASKTTAETKDRQALILKTDYSDTEFFVVEYRKKGSSGEYEEQLPGSGLIVYRVNTEYTKAGNISGPPDFIYVYRSGDQFGSHGYEEAGGDYYNSYLSQESGRTSYGSSDPAASLSEGAITYGDGTNSGIEITNVGKADGDQITFDITFHDTTGGEAWKTVAKEEADAGTSGAAYCLGADGRLYALLKKGSATSLYECKEGKFVKLGDAPSGSDHRLAEYGGLLYAVYFNRSSAACLARWNGSSWQELYAAPRTGNDLSLASDNQGVYLAYQYAEGMNTQIFAVGYTEAGISNLGSQVSSSDKGAANPSIAAENGNVVVTYRESMNGNQICVKQYRSDSNSWDDVGTTNLKAEITALSKVKINHNKIYLMTYLWQLGGKKGYVHVFDMAGDGNWEQLGENAYADVAVGNMDLCFDNEEPYLAYSYGLDPTVVEVKQLKDNQWTNVGVGVARENLADLQLFVYRGRIYAAYRNTNSASAVVRGYGEERQAEYQPYWENGNHSNLVVFVDFADNADHAHTRTENCFKANTDITFQYFNGSETKPRGMRQYLYNISYGKLRVENIFPQYDEETKTITPYLLSHEESYYVNNETAMVTEILEKLNSSGQLQGSMKLDLGNREKIVDNLNIVTASGEKEWLINHRAEYAGDIRVAGCLVRDYTVVTEKSAYLGFSNSGVIIHEFLHTLGYPDLYRMGEGRPVGTWDIMASASYRVQYPLAYLRSAYTGWFEIPSLTESREGLSLYAATTATEETKDQQALILKTDYSDTEFFVVEYRKEGSRAVGSEEYDAGIPGSGLLVYRVDTTRDTNYVGDRDHIYLFRPGDSYGSDGRELAAGNNYQQAHLSAETGRTRYGSSNFEDSLSEGAITYSDGTNSGIVISNVGSAAGDQITFDITFYKQEEGALWNIVASEEEGAGTNGSASCMDKDGNIYSILRKGNRNYLYRCKDGAFTRLGGELAGYFHKLTYYDGKIYTVYVENQKVKLAQWNGSSWKNLYTSAHEANEVALASDSRGVYLAYVNTDGTKVYAAGYTEEAGMEEFGSQVCISDGYACNPSITAENGTVIVLYKEAFKGNGIFVKQYNGEAKTWSDVGHQDFTADSGIIRIRNGKVYLVKSGSGQEGGEKASYLYSYDLRKNTGWQQVGSNHFADTSIPEMDLCFIGNDPYIAYLSGEQLRVTEVKYLKDESWTRLGNSVDRASLDGLAIYSFDGMIYVVYANQESGRAYVKNHKSESVEDVSSGIIYEDENGKRLLLREKDIGEKLSEEQILEMLRKNAGDAPFDGISILYTDEYGSLEKKLSQAVINQAGSLLKYDGQLEFGFLESGSGKLTQWHLKELYTARRDYDGTVTAAKTGGVWSLSLSDTDFPAEQVWVSYGEPGLASYQEAEAQGPRTIYYYAEADGERELAGQGEYEHIPAEESEFGELHILNLYDINGLKPGTAYLAETSRSDWRLEYGYRVDEKGEETKGTVEYFGSEEALIAALGSKDAGGNIRIACTGEEQPESIPAELLNLCGQKNWNLEYIRREDTAGVTYVWNLKGLKTGNEAFALDVALSTQEEDLPVEFRERTYIQVEPKGSLPEGASVVLTIRQEGIAGRFGDQELLRLWKREGRKLTFRGTAKPDREKGNWISFELKEASGTVYVISSQSEYGWQMVPDEEDSQREQAVYIENRSGQRVVGWEIVEGRKCYFNEKGYLVQGPAKVDGTWYLFGYYVGNTWGIHTGLVAAGEDGCTYYANEAGVLQKGWQKIGETWHYFSQDEETFGQEAPSRQEGYWVTMEPGSGDMEGRRYYFRSNKSLLKNWQTVDGKRYFFTPEGYARTGWYPNPADKNVYYLDEQGEMRTGYVEVEEAGESRHYFFHTNGTRQYGWQRVMEEDGEYRWRYFNGDPSLEKYAYGQEIASESKGGYWYEMEGETYYFTKNTKLATGWQTIDGKRYYFDSQGSMYTGTWKIGSSYYHFCTEQGLEGVLGTGLFEDGGNTYYANGSGVLQRGWQKIDGEWRFFHHETGAEEEGKIQTNYWAVVSQGEGAEPKIFYFLNGAKLATGWQTIEGRRYYFDGNGILKTGFFQVGKNTYYGKKAESLEETEILESHPGEVLAGEQNIDGGVYYFGSSYEMYTGWQRIDNVWRYFSMEETSPARGKEKQTSGPEIEETWYWYTADGGRYCFRNNASLLKGWQTINGERYYLDPATGAAVTGTEDKAATLKIGNYVYCFDEKGVMQKDTLVEGYGYNAKGYRVSGWQKLNGRWHYFDTSDAKNPDTWKEVQQAESGRGADWITLDFGGERGRETYYFRNNSSLVKNWQNIDGRRYYFDPKTGALQTGNEDGWYVIKSNAYYLGEDGALRYGWIREKAGQTYYANSSGVLLRGWQKIDNLWYYFSRENYRQDEDARVERDYFATAHEGGREDTYYFVNGTTLAKGWQTIGGIRYYFDTATNVLQTGFFQVGKGWYCFLEDHTPRTGWWKRPETGRYYYFNANGQAVTGWQTIKAADGTSAKYYFDANGVMQTQRTKIGNTWYFFGPDGKMRTGFVKYCDTMYYFKGNGQMLKGWQTIEGQRYYFDTEGALQTGFITLGKFTYYFDERISSLGQMLKGEQEIQGAVYYFNNSGVLQYGWKRLNYVWRFFDLATGAERNTWKSMDDWMTIQISETETARSFINNGTTVLKNWQTIGGKRYYFDANGLLWTQDKGWLTVGKNQFYFKEDGSVFQGFLELEGDTYYLNANGQMQKGWLTVKEDGVSSKYYLDPVSGRAWKGHCQIGKNWYYFDPADHGKMAVGYVRDAVLDGYYYNSSGVRQRGWQKVDVPEEGNVWKYFAPETGKECPVTIDENYWVTVDLGEDRTERAYLKGGTKILTGWQTINEKRYYFDSQGFQWTEEKKWLTIGKNRYYFDSSKDNSVYQGFLALDGNTYYLNANGQMLTGWQTITFEGVKGKYYLDPAEGFAFMGHRQVGKNWYYFDPAEHGKMAVGYITDTDGDHYYYNGSGVLLTGWHKLPGEADYHYFDPEGNGNGTHIGVERSLKERNAEEDIWTVTSGRKTDTYYWYIIEEPGCTSDGARYCFKNNTSLLKNRQNIDGKNYWFHSSTGALYTGYFGIGQNRYRAYEGTEEGRLAGEVYTGFGPVEEGAAETGYYDSYGQRVMGWQTITDGNGDSARYYFNANGVMLEGVSWIGKDRYVFRDSGKEAGQLVMGSDSLDEGSGMAQIQGVGTCYADKNGKLKTGWSRFTKGGDYEWKYLSEETGAEQTVQDLSKADGEEQRIETDSRYVWYQVTEGEGAGTYCIYNNKTLLKKYQSIGGRRYYFNASSGKLQKGWFLAGTNRCYGDPVSGEIRSGRQQIGADWYYLNGDGKPQTGWQTIKAPDGTSARYYFDEKGVLQTGFQQIGKATYYLLEDEGTENGASEGAGAMQTGLVIIGDGQDAGTYYFNGKGEMQKGWISLNMPEEGVVWKYFGADGKEIEPTGTPGPTPPAVRPGASSEEENSIDQSYTWYQIGDDWYCVQNNQKLVKGLTNLTGGYRFYLDKITGALVRGHFLDGKTHCYSDAGDGRIEPFGRLVEETDGESSRVVRYCFDGNGKRVTGWKTVEGPDGNKIKYYFEPSNGQAACGWTQIGKQAYYFDRNSGELKKATAEDLLRITEAGGREVLYYTGGGEYLLSGLYSVKGEWYYFDPTTKEGGEVTAIQDGRNTLIVLENGTRHLLKDGKTLAKGWQTITVDGEKGSYYFDSQGVLKKGWVNDGKKRYYTDENTGKAISGFMTFVNGVREEGIREGNTCNSYYFDANGLMKTGWITLADAVNPKVKHVYYCNANGILLKGICWIGNKRYVLDPNTGERSSDSVEIGGVRYYANGDGTLKTGWQKAGGKSYYYGTDGRLVIGWKTIDRKVYYFDAEGVMQTGYQTGLPVQGSQVSTNTASYYFNNSGVLQTGWFRFSENKRNVWRFFGKDGKELEPKKERDESPKGDKVNGYRWYLVNNDWYCIQKDSKVLKGFYNIGTWRYYFDSTTGALKKGHFTDGKSWYYSEPATGAINRSGYKLEETVRDRKEISYFDGNGKRVTGWKNLEEVDAEKGKVTNRYYFDPSDGLAASGFVRIGKQDYYFDVDTKVLQKSMLEKNAPLELISVQRNGREVLYYTGKYEYLLSGWQKVNGSWYYFDAVTKEGEEAQVIPSRDGNWVELGDRSQYYFKNGTTLARDWQTISVNGDSGRYYFDKNGVLQTGWLGISGKRYYTDELTGKAAKEEFLYFADGVCQSEKPESGEFDTYYFDKNGLMKTGWLTLTESDGAKRSYYFNISGEMRKGLCWVGNTCYVLDPKEGFRIENGSVVIDGKIYYANSKGILKTGWEKVNGKSYYYGTDGQRAAGWKEIEGKVYYFDPDQDDAMQIGYRKELPIRGSLQSGEEVKKAAYYFNGSGVMQTGWFLIDVPEEGRIWKYFGTDGREILPADKPVEITPEGEEIPGYVWYRIEEPGSDGREAAENWYCIYKNKVLKGSNKIGSWKYYFDSATGALQKGHFTVGTARYYSKPDTGAIDVNGCFYTDPESGDIYYYDGNGKQVTGWLTIKSGEHAGKYYFHSLTGAAYRGGWYYVDNTAYLFDLEGKVREVPVITLVESSNFRTASVTWKGVVGAKRYVLECAEDASFTMGLIVRTIEDEKQTSLTVTDLTPGLKYYFRLKYVLKNRQDGEDESVYSAVKNIVIQGEVKPTGSSASFRKFLLEKEPDGSTRIQGEFQVKGRLQSYNDGNYYLVRVDSYSNSILSASPLHTISKDDGRQEGDYFYFDFRIPLPQEFDGDRNLQEVLMSKYSLAVKSGENKYTVISPGTYVGNPEFAAEIDTPYYMPSSKKGIQGARAEWVIDAGTKNTLMNLDLKKVVLKGKQEGCVEYSYKGKLYYFDSLAALRETVSRFNQEETDQYGRKREPVQITFAILMSYDSGLADMIEPAARRAGAAPYYALNTRNQSSQERLEAVFSYLGEIFGQDDCYVSNWILGNEVNSCNAWNYTGGMGLSDYMKGYANAFRILYCGVKQTRPSSRIFISLDNAWTRAVAGYAGKSVLNSFASQIYSEAPFVSWDLSFHPYSAPLTRTDFWNDGSNTTNSVNSPFISMRNLNYLNQYLADMENRFGRGNGSIKMILSEQGWTSTGRGGEKGQARALAQAYYIAEFNDRVLAFTIRAEKDDPKEVRDGLSMGLRDGDEKYKPAYYVYRYMDTPVKPSSDSSEKLISEYNRGNLWLSDRQWTRFREAQEVMAMDWKNIVPGYQEDKLNGMPYAFPM